MSGPDATPPTDRHADESEQAQVLAMTAQGAAVLLRRLIDLRRRRDFGELDEPGYHAELADLAETARRDRPRSDS